MKNKIYKYDFLVIGAGLIGTLTGLSLLKKGYSVLVVDNNMNIAKDKRTLAVNANSKDFLINLSLWNKLRNKPQSINQIIIKDFINKSTLTFQEPKEEMGNVIFNYDLLTISRNELQKKNLLMKISNLSISNLISKKTILMNKKKFIFKNIILSLGKKYADEKVLKKYNFPNSHNSYVGFFDHSKSHNQLAYEIFTEQGPLAVLPSPKKKNTSSTFIYSTKDNPKKKDLLKLIKANFYKSHGIIKFENEIHQYEVLPHLSKNLSNDYFLIGDILRSIHPVAGQGWNLGVKDIQVFLETIDRFGLDSPNIANKYFQKRIIENISYLSFTSLINSLYENQNFFTNFIIKFGFNALKKSNLLRNIFIKQAMGRIKLV